MSTGTEARRGLGPAWVAIALGALVAVAFVVSARVEADVSPQPLELHEMRVIDRQGGVALVRVEVGNVIEHPVELLDVAVPDVASARSGTGTKAAGIAIAPSATGEFLLRLPASCPQNQHFDRIEVLVRVAGDRELVQSLGVDDSLDLGCP